MYHICNLGGGGGGGGGGEGSLIRRMRTECRTLCPM